VAGAGELEGWIAGVDDGNGQWRNGVQHNSWPTEGGEG